jgi:hypothetical protein
MLHRCEAVFFFCAMMLAIILEASFVYWMCQNPLDGATPPNSFSVVGEWTGMALPQAWLLGAFFVLVYRLLAIAIPPTSWTGEMFSRNRQAFLRLWRWTIAISVMQGFVLFLARPVV